MSNPAIQMFCASNHPMDRGADWCGTCGLPPASKASQESARGDGSSAKEPCTDHTPPSFVGHWKEWHRGHGCDKDDGRPRSDDAKVEISQIAANATTGYLTDAELRLLRASTTSGNDLLVRALDELAARRVAEKWNTPVRRGLAHCMMGPPGHRCSCGAEFSDYSALAEHVRQTIDCPRCGAPPADLGDSELYRWQCGHWIARNDASATIRNAERLP